MVGLGGDLEPMAIGNVRLAVGEAPPEEIRRHDGHQAGLDAQHLTDDRVSRLRLELLLELRTSAEESRVPRDRLGLGGETDDKLGVVRILVCIPSGDIVRVGGTRLPAAYVEDLARSGEKLRAGKVVSKADDRRVMGVVDVHSQGEGGVRQRDRLPAGGDPGDAEIGRETADPVWTDELGRQGLAHRGRRRHAGRVEHDIRCLQVLVARGRYCRYDQHG